MSSLTDLVVIGAVGVGAYYLYNNWSPAKAAANTTIETIGSTLDLAANPDLDAVKENLKDANKKVVEEINDSFNVDLPTTPAPVIDTIVDLKGGSVLPNLGVPAIVNKAKDFFSGMFKPATEGVKVEISKEDSSLSDVSAKSLMNLKGAELTDSGIPVQTNLLPGQGIYNLAKQFLDLF